MTLREVATSLCLVGIGAIAGYHEGKRAADKWYAQPYRTITSGTNTSAVMAFPMCDVDMAITYSSALGFTCDLLPEVEVIWHGNSPSCPTGYMLWADQGDALKGLPSAHCVRGE